MNPNKVLATAVAMGGFMAGVSTFDNTVYANSEIAAETFSATRQGRTNVNLNMRAGAGTNHRILRTLPRNTNITILSESNGWMRVRAGTQEGWVAARYVTVTSGNNNNNSGGNSAVARQGRTNVNLNMRAGAGTSHRVLRTLPRNTNLTILSEGNGWMRVRVGNNEGWVSARYVTVIGGNNNNNTGGSASTATRQGRTNVNLNMRTGAGTNHQVLRILPRNTNLTILSESNGWMRVRVGTQEGWVSARYVTVTGGNNNNNSNPGGGTSTATRTGRTNANVNKRAGASTNHRVMRVLPRNTDVTILNQNSGWKRVRVGTQEGYVAAQFVTVTNDTNNNTNNNVGGDRWNIMGRFNITPIAASNQGRYIDIISEVSAMHGVPIPLIQRIIEVESSFRNGAVSPAGARGLMQLMPATAASLGVTNSHDPRQNIEAGTRYLSQHLRYFNGDLVLALAAYNAGIGNVRRHGGVPPFRETINYIQRITGIDVTRTLLSGVELIDMPERDDSDVEFFDVEDPTAENVEFETESIIIPDVEVNGAELEDIERGEDVESTDEDAGDVEATEDVELETESTEIYEIEINDVELDDIEAAEVESEVVNAETIESGE